MMPTFAECTALTPQMKATLTRAPLTWSKVLATNVVLDAMAGGQAPRQLHLVCVYCANRLDPHEALETYYAPDSADGCMSCGRPSPGDLLFVIQEVTP